MIRVIIAGSRPPEKYANGLLSVWYQHVGPWAFVEIEEALQLPISMAREGWPRMEVISGMARGFDIIGAQWATQRQMNLTKMPANWETHGKGAGMLRNSQMASYAVEHGSHSLLIAFWDKKSKGTKNMIDKAASMGIPVVIVDVSGRFGYE